MNYCTNCGHALGVGRFCTNCGNPVPGRHPAAAPTAPADAASRGSSTQAAPVTSSVPPAARYPLYADTPLGAPPTAPPAAAPAPAATESLAQRPAPAYVPGVRSVRGLVIAAVVLALLVIAVGWAALVMFDSDGKATDKHKVHAGSAASAGTTTETTGATGKRHHGRRAPGTDLTDQVTEVEVPATAPASADLSGRPVTFGAHNLVDGDLQTAWRMAGDGAGGSITLTFARPVTLTSVGLINGYAKKYPGYNGYWLNRKVTQVRWTFEDGSTVTQDLRRVTRMQTIPVHPGPTSSLKIDIVTTVPSNKANSRDYTAISELALVGSAE